MRKSYKEGQSHKGKYFDGKSRVTQLRTNDLNFLEDGLRKWKIPKERILQYGLYLTSKEAILWLIFKENVKMCIIAYVTKRKVLQWTISLSKKTVSVYGNFQKDIPS